MMEKLKPVTTATTMETITAVVVDLAVTHRPIVENLQEATVLLARALLRRQPPPQQALLRVPLPSLDRVSGASIMQAWFFAELEIQVTHHALETPVLTMTEIPQEHQCLILQAVCKMAAPVLSITTMR
jgi:hypothetical protein